MKHKIENIVYKCDNCKEDIGAEKDIKCSLKVKTDNFEFCDFECMSKWVKKNYRVFTYYVGNSLLIWNGNWI